MPASDTNDDPHAHRRGLTFGQAEGVEDLPRQLELREVSKELRAKLLLAVISSMVGDKVVTDYGPDRIGGAWADVLVDLHVQYRHGYIDEYSWDWEARLADISNTIKSRPYTDVFGTVQFILQHRKCPAGLAKSVGSVLVEARAAYRVVSGGLIVPISSEVEAEAIDHALKDLRLSKRDGARKHLEAAITAVTAGLWATSVRESIQAVEAVARTLEPSATTLAPALDKLSKAGHVHPALKAGLSKVYGYTSDEPGIRHPLLEDGDAKVDETDALFMIGACASFVSYMIGKARTGGLLGK